MSKKNVFRLGAIGCCLSVLSLLAHAALVHLLGQLVEPITQRLLLLLQVCHILLALLALLALLTLLALWRTLLATLALLTALAALVLALLEGSVTQLLLAADHVGQFIELPHHFVVALAALLLLAGLCRLQVVEHLLQFLEQLARGIAVAVTRHLLHAVDHALEILRPHLP